MPSPRVRVQPGQTAKDIKVTNLPLAKVRPDPNQPRKFFDEQAIADLAKSIERHGLINPVMVRRDPKDKEGYVVVAGERRYRAHLLLEKETIPSIITAGDKDEISIIENLQREDLSPIEEAEALERLRKKHGYTHKELAEVVGKARSTITNLLKLNDLAPSIKREAVEYGTARSILIEVSKLEGKAQKDLWAKYKQGDFTVKKARRAKKGTKADEREALRAFKSLNTTLGRVNEEAERLSPETYDQLLTQYQKLGSLLDRAARKAAQ